MIPSMLLFGLVFGRWWKFALAIGTVGWPLVVFQQGSLDGWSAWIYAALLGLANTGVGVGVHQLLLWLWRLGRRVHTRSSSLQK